MSRAERKNVERPVTYYFRPVVAEDLPFLYQGLQQPEVRRWWGEPDHELGLIRGDISSPLIDLKVVLADGQPVAYIQDYAISDWPQDHLLHLPDGSRAIDTFITSESAMGRGHCAGYLRQRAEVLLQRGCPLVVIDPDPENHRAVRAYQKAGFTTEHPMSRHSRDALILVFGG
ncbi:MAG: acetyltransferase [Gammaproteobacteria bacterium]|nr:acetyltransferase [Gammaproteobacteria bacterium]